MNGENELRITFISRYGSSNLGDELIVRELEKLFGKSEIERYDNSLNNYTSLEGAFNHQQFHKPTKDSKPILKKIYREKFRTTLIISFIRNLINNNRAKYNKNIIMFEQSLKNSDLLVIGGGNLIFDLEKKSNAAFYLDIPISKAVKHNVPIFILNVGIGPFQTQKQLTKARQVIGQVNYISVRDESSYELLAGLKKPQLYQTIDPVVFLPKAKGTVGEVYPKNSIGISVMDIRLANYTEEEYIQYLDCLNDVAQHLIEVHNKKIVFFCTEENDLVALSDLRSFITSMASNTEKCYFSDEVSLEELKNVYLNIEGLIGTRMHSLIISFSQSIPFMGISWQEKVKGFGKMIANEDYIISIEEFLSNKKNKDMLDSLVLNLADLSKRFSGKKQELEFFLDINQEIINKVDKNRDSK